MKEIRLYNTDEQLLQGFKENDDRAWSKLLNDKDLRGMIISLVLKNSGNKDDAEDVLQMTIEVLIEKIKIGAFELKASLKTYLYAVARNIWYKILRERNKLPKNPTDDYPEIPFIDDELLPNKKELTGPLNRQSNALDEISEQCRSLLLEFHGEEKSLEEIMVSLNGYYSTYVSIKNAISRCRKKLKEAYYAKK
jgi:RNA polymerase sigma factor (sigma-70 family)